MVYFYFPTREHLQNQDIRELTLLWKYYHNALLKIIKRKRIPYDERAIPFFGLHGTSYRNYETIATLKNPTILLATFSKNENSEQQLFTFYNMCAYAAAYAYKNQSDIGGILVFEFIGGKTNAITRDMIRKSRELIGPRGSMSLQEPLKQVISTADLLPDSNKDKKFWHSLEKEENMGRVGFYQVDPGDSPGAFNHDYRGFIDIRPLMSVYVEPLEEVPRRIL